MGVRKFYNKWRAYYKINGKDFQEYFDTEELANERMEFVNELRAKIRPKSTTRNKKRSTAKNQDLPVGYFEYPDKRLLASGEVIYESLKCVFVCNGKLKHMVRAYGINRTRAEALKELQKAVDKYVKQHKKNKGGKK